MSTTRILDSDAIAAVVREVGLDTLYDELIERLVAACESHDAERMVTFDRTGFHYTKPDLGLIEWMPTLELGRRVSIKTVGYHPTNPTERGLPSVLATTSVHDTTDGRFLALCEATFLTALRTGAASAVATDVLAVADAHTLGVVGCGAQAVTQIHAISRVRPIDRVVAYDADTDVAATLESRVPVEGLEFEIVGAHQLERLLAEADIVCTATSVDIGAPPVLPDREHQPWLHLNAVGADFPGKLELAGSMLSRALVCPDVVAQCLAEGESQQLTVDDLGPDLASLVRERDRYRAHRHDLSVFDSTGWALEDLVAAELMLDHAERLGEGIDVQLQPRPADPYDPYELLRP